MKFSVSYIVRRIVGALIFLGGCVGLAGVVLHIIDDATSTTEQAKWAVKIGAFVVCLWACWLGIAFSKERKWADWIIRSYFLLELVGLIVLHSNRNIETAVLFFAAAASFIHSTNYQPTISTTSDDVQT